MSDLSVNNFISQTPVFIRERRKSLRELAFLHVKYHNKDTVARFAREFELADYDARKSVVRSYAAWAVKVFRSSTSPRRRDILARDRWAMCNAIANGAG